MPPGGPVGSPDGGRPRGAGDRPGRSEGGGYDFGDIGAALAEGTAVVLGLAGGVIALRHYRTHGADKPPQRTTLERRIEDAVQDPDDEHDPAATPSGPSPSGPSAWGNAVNGRYALNVGGKSQQALWLDPTTAPGIGFVGPGAFGAMRSCWLSILLHIGNKPPGRVIMPVTDAIRLLGTSRPDTTPEGLFIVEDLDHAKAALTAEIRERAAAPPDQLADMPMVALMLAEAPADPTETEELAELLRVGQPLGVVALIGDDWPEGATLEIDRRSVVTATYGGLDHLHDAFLFHQSTDHVANACRRIDQTNEITASRDPADTTSGDDAIHAPAEATTATQNQPAPHTAHEPPADPTAPEPECGPAAPDASAASAVPAHSSPPEAEAQEAPDTERSRRASHDDHAAFAVSEPAPTSAIPSAPEPNQPGAIAMALSGDRGDTLPPPPSDSPAHVDDNTASPTGPTTGVVRLELMRDTPRLFWLPQASLDESDPLTSINITPNRGKTQMEVLVNAAVNRDGQSRAAAAAALWPDTNIERPTNTYNSYRTRLRAMITERTNGVITELIQDNEDGTCQLHPDLVQVDYWEFLDAIESTAPVPERARAYLNAVKNYRGALAVNIDAEWINEVRDQTQTAALRAAIDLAHDLAHNHDDPDTAVAILDKAITFDPHNEPIYQQLLLLLRKLRRRDAAMQRYQALEKALYRLDGLEPLPETTKIIEVWDIKE
jgi:DNA-binding SARP family transcriptional activator